MAFSLNTIQTAFSAFLTAQGVTNTAKAAIVALGGFPLFPLVVTINTDYTTIATAQANWLSSYSSLSGTYQTALASQRAAELAVIAAIVSVTTNTTTPPFGANEWYVAASGDTWFGYSSTDVSKIDGLQYLVVETSHPTKPFINSIS